MNLVRTTDFPKWAIPTMLFDTALLSMLTMTSSPTPLKAFGNTSEG